jgi:hypothetical protein
MIQLSDGRVVTPEQFKAEHRNVIYSGLYPSAAYLNTIGAKQVLVDPKPEITDLQVLLVGSIVDRNGTPYQTWEVKDKTESQIQQEQNAQKLNNKTQAEKLLQATDWTQVADVPLLNKQEFVDYRAAVRAIALNPPVQAIFPDLPVEQWS